ncbi:MAG TPA: dihydroneopterin aldolase, partial [Dongiaceae bacterium]|nr:dihydroneopterin aldolase [Dongiaceae bacterium]
MAPDVNRRIFIRDFRLQVSIGIHDFEKEGPQSVVVNVDLLLEPQSKAHNDRIANVLNYDTVHDGITKLAGSRHFNLQ